jgi:hypothetical protein
MKHHTHDNIAQSLRAKSDGRFVDLHNLPKPRWRDALVALAAPARRVHEYRNLHRSMFYGAVRDLDCGDSK